MDMNSVDRIREYSSLPSENYGAALSIEGVDTLSHGQAATASVTATHAGSYQNDVAGQFQGDVESGVELTAQQQNRGDGGALPCPWPTAGEVVFKNIYMTYKTVDNAVLR